MDELFTLVFILLIVLASVFDAVARNKRKRQQKERMEAEEAEEAETDFRPDPRMRREPGGVRQEGGVATEERETADTMVPDDLWKILTGQLPEESPGQPAPPRPVPREEPREQPEQEVPGPRYEWEKSRRQPETPMPAPQDRMGTSRAEPQERAEEFVHPERRSERWMAGIDREGRRVRSEIEEEEARIYELPPEPWDQFEDIAAAEIREGEGIGDEISDEGDDLRSRRRRARRGRGARYTRLLETGEIDDLRAGLVLKEVLGPPAAFNEPGPEWG